MSVAALTYFSRKIYSSRIWLACALLTTMVVLCSCDQNDSPNLDGVCRPFAFIPSYKIDGKSIVFRTGKKHRITKISMARFEHVKSHRLKLHEYFLVHLESRSALLLSNYALYTAPNKRLWVRNTQWHTAIVTREEVEKWEDWLERHGNKKKPPPINRPGATRFFKTRGPKREISAEQYGLVEKPVKSGRRIWIKK